MTRRIECGSHAGKNEQDKVMKESVWSGASHQGSLVFHKTNAGTRWQPSQGIRQDLVDRRGARGERLGMLEAWCGEVVPCMRGFWWFTTKPSGSSVAPKSRDSLLVWPQNQHGASARLRPSEGKLGVVRLGLVCGV